MAKKRPSIPKALAESVLKEFRHKCAICGRHQPHLHHLDQNPEHNEAVNLLPLCPNCHLQDTHDPTSAPDPRKLQLFRKFKDPLILDPRFHPIFTRMQFVREWAKRDNAALFKLHSNELLDFIVVFAMGEFYRKKIQNFLNGPASQYSLKLFLEGVRLTKAQVLADPKQKQAAWENSADQIEALVVEMMRYQNWSIPSQAQD